METPKRVLGKFRDQRQRFDLGADFIWRRRIQVGHTDAPKGKRERIWANPGDPVDKDSLSSAAKLKRLWLAEYIELAVWDLPARGYRKVGPALQGGADGSRPSGAVPEPSVTIRKMGPDPEELPTFRVPPTVKKLRGGWFLIQESDGTDHRVRGREAMEEKLAELVRED